MVHLRAEVRPRWPFRLPRGGGADRVARVGRHCWMRLLHCAGEPVVLRASQPSRDLVLLEAQAESRAAAAHGLERLRFALALDDDLRPFHERFRWDPLIGRALRADPYLRVTRRPEPFEALAWAICEQLIEAPRAAMIERRIVARLGRSCARTGLADLPDAARLAATAPALLQSMDLSAGRALTLVRAAREVAGGRVDLHAADHERAWRRLRAIPGIGAWTVEKLALHGQGRHDQLPAGDLAYLKLVGRLTTGNPRARADEQQVRDFFAGYGSWAGLAGAYALRSRLPGGRMVRFPGRAGTRSSTPVRRSAAA